MVVVMPYERVLIYRRGKLDRILDNGQHRIFGLKITRVWIDTRQRIVDVKAQEIPTADGITVKVNAGFRMHVTDPIAFHEKTHDPESFVYVAAKSALRDLVRARTLEGVAAGIAVEQVPESVVTAAAEVGLTVDTFEVRDVIVPVEIRRANDELVASRQQSQIALEKARSEIAVLRAMANSAKVLEDHPVLAALRLAETAGKHGGTVVVERPSA